MYAQATSMKLQNALFEGGNAIKNASPIRGDLALPVANQLMSMLQQKYTTTRMAPLGSTGKKGREQRSGDIDIAVEMDFSQAQDVQSFIQSKIQGNETNLMSGLEILSIGYPYSIDGVSGTVQADLMFVPSLDLAAFFYHSPNYIKGESSFKGMVRNVLMIAILKHVPTGVPNTQFENGHTKDLYKYTIKPKQGLVLLHQTYLGKKGVEVKSKTTIKEDTRVVETSPEKIVEIMLGKGASVLDVNSFESTWNWLASDKFAYKDQRDAIVKDFIDDLSHEEPKNSDGTMVSKVKAYIDSHGWDNSVAGALRRGTT